MSLKTKIIILAILVLLLVALKFGYAWLERQCARCYEPVTKNTVNQLTKDYANLKIVYSKNNGSLPPDYHKEYVYSISTDASGAATGEYAVKDYKDTLEKKPLSVNAEQVKKLMTIAAKITSETKDSNMGCTGGSNKSIAVSQNKNVLLGAASYNCAGKASNESMEKASLEIEKILVR